MDRKEAIEVIKKNWPDSSFTRLQNALETLIPELKESEESEDEKIRKSLIKSYTIQRSTNFPTEDGFTREQILAWLKKQGTSYTKKDVDDAYLEGVTNTKNEIEKQYEANYQIRKDIATFIFNYRGDIKDRTKWIDYLGIKVSFVEKQGEHNLADKVEPKFKVGDWFVNNISKDVFLIKSINNGYCTLEDTKGDIISPCLPPCESESHLWTIKDAKDGDVLADNYGIYIFDRFDEYDKRCYICMGAYQYSQKVYENEHMLCSVEVHPATKEQRDLLFKKMHEAGYEWDAEKKELKKIEQNPAWSEEDEKEYRRVEYAIMKVFGGDAYLIGWIRKFKNKLLHQTTWKPSEEQMDALYTYIYNPQYFNSPDPRMELVESVYKDLKKLREE